MSDETTMPTTKEPKQKKPKAAKAEAPANPLALSGEPVAMKVSVKDVYVYRDLQARKDIDAGSTVDEARAEQFAAAMKAGDRFPPIKCMRIPSKNKKDEFDIVVWDGMHTHRGAEIAKVKELDALVWDGTAQQALMAAATIANREHEKNGKPLSNRDKLHAVEMAAMAFTKSDIPKKDWPSNRQLAELVGVSHTLVNDLDPFKRKPPTAPSREEKLEQKREAAKKRERDDDDDGAEVEAASDDPAPGSEIRMAAVFDWKEQDRCMGYVIRSIDAMGDTFDLKKTDPKGMKRAYELCDQLVELLKQWKAAATAKDKAA